MKSYLLHILSNVCHSRCLSGLNLANNELIILPNTQEMLCYLDTRKNPAFWKNCLYGNFKVHLKKDVCFDRNMNK